MRRAVATMLLAMLGIASFGFAVTFAGADTATEGTWVRMHGVITQWGSSPVFGWIDAQAGMVNRSGDYHEWARVHATWSDDRPRLNCTRPPLENFTVVIYAAKLVNTTDVAFNELGADFYVSGFWNVVKITTTVTVILDETAQVTSIDIHRECEPIVTNRTGELRVFLAPMRFELAIRGIDLLSGHVRLFDVRHIEIKICDIDGDGTVDLIDLVRVAKRYRAVPGLWNYDHTVDFNFNDEIDVGDLTTVAANIGL